MLVKPGNTTGLPDYSWILGNDYKKEQTAAGAKICCATFPHLGADGKTILKDKYCYPKSVLNMELDPAYLLPGQVNPYPLAWCNSLSLSLGAALLLSSVLLF